MRIFCILLMILIFSPAILRADVIFHADGSIIDAKIVRQTATSVTIKLKNKRTRLIKGNDILRIRENPVIKKGIKVFDIEKGQILETNLVDETDFSYAFRNVMTSPNEFRINKTKAVIIYNTIESGIDGIPGAKDISLQWSEIQDVPRYIVARVEPDNKYVVIYDGPKSSLTIDSVRGNTLYKFTLFAVDVKGNGFASSEPSEFMTLNNPPLSPTDVKCTELPGDASSSLMVSWKKAEDSDGFVSKYRIFIKDKTGFLPVAETDKTEWIFESYDRSVIRTFSVSAIDNNSAESAKSELFNSRDAKRYFFKIDPHYIYPLGAMSDIYDYGAGANISIEKPMFSAFWYGGSLGFTQFKGSGKSKGDLFQLLAVARYDFNLTYSLIAAPSFAFGPAYYGGNDSTGKAFSRFALYSKLGGDLIYSVSKDVNLSAGLFAGTIYEDSKFRYFAGASISAGLIVEL